MADGAPDPETAAANEIATFITGDEPADEANSKTPENDADDKKDAENQDDDENSNVNDEADDPEKDDDEEKPEKRRSKPASQRIAEITAKLRQTERELQAEREGKKADEPTVELPDKPDPNDDKYEFGEADPNYLADLTDWKVETKLAEREQKRQVEAQREKASELGRNLDTQWTEKATKAAEKYEDFGEKVVEGAADGKWPLLPLSAAALQSSEVGDDIAYHLATNPSEAEELASLEREFHETRQAAIEGGIAPELAMKFAKPYLDQATKLFNGIEAKFKEGKKKAKIATDAPDPPKHNVRGAGGKFEVDATTTDFAAFEAKANSK